MYSVFVQRRGKFDRVLPGFLVGFRRYTLKASPEHVIPIFVEVLRNIMTGLILGYGKIYFEYHVAAGGLYPGRVRFSVDPIVLTL